GNVMRTKQFINGGVVPCSVPEFEGVAMVCRKKFQKRLKPDGVNIPAWGQLKQHRPKLVAECRRVVQKGAERVTRREKFFHVCYVSAGFNCKEEIRRTIRLPFFKGRFRRQVIKGIIQF